ncbi:MAG: alkyl hydroperoxide reductase, partial [Verrucomicrobiaceae bacterium]|nr:alkyl hydroperoxide reductase [Verrucomicrobiaceae bacterium]
MRPGSLLLAVLCVASLVAGEEEAGSSPLAGHSYHGEVFNEGPRQAAVLIPGTGGVDFPVTTDSAEARRFFQQGVGQLHGYWFFEAERSFRQVAALDPDCAMAYWGMAMANFKNDSRGKKFIDEAVRRKDRADARETLWIAGLAAYFENPKADLKKRLRDYTRSLEEIVMAYPDDLEAKAVLLHQVYYNSGKELPISSHYAMNLLAEEILTKAPQHPANHFQIHLWDKTDAARALAAAARCGPAAPAIAHMWHMPGHIYSKLHRYADAAWQQEASARVDHAHMMRYRIVPDEIHNFAHNNEWLIRNLNHLGQLDRSVALARNMISLPRLAKFTEEKGKSVYDPDRGSWQYGRQRLRDTLVRFE